MRGSNYLLSRYLFYTPLFGRQRYLHIHPLLWHKWIDTNRSVHLQWDSYRFLYILKCVNLNSEIPLDRLLTLYFVPVVLHGAQHLSILAVNRVRTHHGVFLRVPDLRGFGLCYFSTLRLGWADEGFHFRLLLHWFGHLFHWFGHLFY